MEDWIHQLNILIWDFDGTFYPPNKELFHVIREAEYRTIMDHTGWSKEKTVEEFEKVHKKVYVSATETTAALSGISISEAAIEMEAHFDRRDYLKRDERLITLFGQLHGFRHFILANGVVRRHLETLQVLGIPASTFEEIVTSEVTGVTKPHEKGFLYILEKTGLPPSSHLMIGDRETVDLIPAKKLGMKTCLVWSEKTSDIADITLPDVYTLGNVLGRNHI